MDEEILETTEQDTTQAEQNSEDNLLNKLAGFFGDEQLEETKPPETTDTQEAVSADPEKDQVLPDDYKVKVKIQGQEQEVTLSELRDGYQRQKDYTQKTTELAQQRQEVEAARQQYDQYIQTVPVFVQIAAQNIAKGESDLTTPEMLKLAQEDPAEYIAKKSQIEANIIENRRSIDQMRAQYDNYMEQINQERQQVYQETLQHSNELLSKQIEGWADGSVKKAIADYALGPGELTLEEVNSLYDHRYVKLLNKARLYDELVSKQGVTQKKVEKLPPKVMKPGNDDQPSEEEDLQTLKKRAIKKYKSGDESELLDLLSGML